MFRTFNYDKTFAVQRKFLRGHARRHGDKDVSSWNAIVYSERDVCGTISGPVWQVVQAEIDLLAQVLNPGDVLLDVRTNIGCHTVPSAKLVDESGRALAFESQRLVFRNSCATLVLNALPNGITYDAGGSRETRGIHLQCFDGKSTATVRSVSHCGHLTCFTIA